MSDPVVVGYDGSAESQAALDFAITEARLRGRRLRLVHGYVVPAVGSLYGGVWQFEDSQRLREVVEQMLDEAVAQAKESAPDLTIDSRAVESITVGSVLVEQSRHAELMVVGSRGRGGFKGLLLGSTSVQLASYAACPVVVVRSQSDQTGPYAGKVVVGVDGSSSSRGALRFGFAEAAMREVSLVAVAAWSVPVSAGPGDMLPLVFDPEQLSEEESRVFSEAMAGWQQEYPTVTVEKRMERGKPRQVLLDLSAGAALLVVGSRGRGGFTGMLLGSTSQAMLHHARVPVAVVRDTQDERWTG